MKEDLFQPGRTTCAAVHPTGNAGLSAPALDDMTQAAFGSMDYARRIDFFGEGAVIASTGLAEEMA